MIFIIVLLWSNCFLAFFPTITPFFVNATMDGNILPCAASPSLLGIILGLLFIITAAAELLVPRSIPMILLIIFHPFAFFMIIIVDSTSSFLKE